MLMSTNHGTMIVNRNDYRMTSGDAGYGVGYQLMNTSSYEQAEVDFAIALLQARRSDFGDGVIAIDCGANIGVHTIEWARAMFGWGSVYSFEAQEKIYYALAGNIALNNCFNVKARLAAVGESCGTIAVPEINYFTPSSFGSVELIPASHEYIGQKVDYSRMSQYVDMITLDSLNLHRIDFIKIDVEGMEAQVLRGAAEVLHRCKPLLILEFTKSNQQTLSDLLNVTGYKSFAMGMNILAVHAADPVLGRLNAAMPQP